MSEIVAPEPSWRTNPNVELVSTRWLMQFPQYPLRDRVRYNDVDYGSFDQLVDHIRVHGIQLPLTLHVGRRDGRATLGEGNHRLAAAVKLGLREVPLEVEVTGTLSEFPRDKTIDVSAHLIINRASRGETTLPPSRVFDSSFLRSQKL